LKLAIAEKLPIVSLLIRAPGNRRTVTPCCARAAT